MEPGIFGAYNCAAVLVGTAVLLVYFLFVKRPKNCPPGPIGLPIVGYTPFLGSNAAETLMKMKCKYGPIFTVQIGRENWIILNDYDTINEAFVKRGDVYSDRPKNFIFDLLTQGYGLTILDYGKTWTTFRKFGLKHLKGFGFGRKALEENVVEESSYLVEHLTTNNSTSTHMKLMLAVSNIICKVIFGSRFSYDDKKFTRLLNILSGTFVNSINSRLIGIMTFSPELRHFQPFKGALNETKKHLDALFDIFNEIIEEHKKDYDENDIRDFVDAFLKEMTERQENDSSFSPKHLLYYIKDVFQGGSETISSTLSWAMLCFANYPEYQDNIIKEIQSVVGESGIPTMQHRDELPYTCAFIQELMRHRTLAPLGLYHRTSQETNLRGYTIPKGVTVASNLWAVHHDPDLFENPTEFRPERFLDNDGKFIKSSHVIPFSVGRRHCIGQQLARMEIFIFLTSIVQKLKVVPDPKNPVPSFNSGTYNFLTFEPPAFKVNFHKY